MLRADTSPVHDRIKQIVNASFPSNIKFSACENSKQGMEKREGKGNQHYSGGRGGAIRRGATDRIAGAGLELLAALIFSISGAGLC